GHLNVASFLSYADKAQDLEEKEVVTVQIIVRQINAVVEYQAVMGPHIQVQYGVDGFFAAEGMKIRERRFVGARRFPRINPDHPEVFPGGKASDTQIGDSPIFIDS